MSNNDLTPSQKQLPSSVDGNAIAKWGTSYAKFIEKYPPGGNQSLSLLAAAERGGFSMARLDKLFGEGAMVYWLKCQLIQLFEYMGLFKTVTEYQVRTIAERIRARYAYLTPAELSVFFARFADGDFALMKGLNVNPQLLMVSLPHFVADVQRARAQAENEKAVQQIEIDKQKFQNTQQDKTSIETIQRRVLSALAVPRLSSDIRFALGSKENNDGNKTE